VEPFLVVAVAVTSLGGYLIGMRWCRRSRADLRAALGRLLECVAAMAVFAALNLLVGAVVILAIRTFTGYFLSLYLLNDVVWLIASLLQGIAWTLWRVDRPGRG
jgi:hypothetical protein